MRHAPGNALDHTRFLKRYAERHLAVHMRRLPEHQRQEVLAKIQPALVPVPAKPSALRRKGKARLFGFFGLVFVVVCLFLFQRIWMADYQNQHLPLGVPEAPLLLTRKAYVLGYDPEKKMATWISYRVQTGDKEAAVDSSPDPAISSSDQAPPDAFKGSIYNRAALIAPRHVTRFTGEELDETRYHTIFVPQSDSVFRSVIRVLDNRVLVGMEQGGERWVMKGPVYGEQALAWNGYEIPDAYFHILLKRESGRWAISAYLISNSAEVSSSKIVTYKVSVDEIEAQTGLDFFADLPTEEEEPLEANP